MSEKIVQDPHSADEQEEEASPPPLFQRTRSHTMFCCTRLTDLLRTFLSLSLLGFAVVVLIGPALAILGVLLPFALIGALALVLYWAVRALLRWLCGRRLRRMPKGEIEQGIRLPVLADALAVEEAPPAATIHQPSRLRSALRTALQITVEVVCGAALGAGLALLIDWQTGGGFERVALGASIGAVVGFVLGGSRRSQEGGEEKVSTDVPPARSVAA
jgi:hypothetical protein